MNNLGYAREKEGELEDAYKYYTQAAAQHSDTPIVVTYEKSWRGKGISQIAEKNAENVQKVMAARERHSGTRGSPEYAWGLGHQP